MKQTKVEKKTVEEQITNINVLLHDLTSQIGALQGIVKAQAGWINEIETRLRKLEKK